MIAQTIVPRLTTGSVGGHLRELALPMALSFVALNSYSITDTFFVGQLGTLPLAAMGFTFPVSFAMVAVGLGIGIATSSVLARLLGTGNRGAVQRITTHALLLGGLLGLLLLVVGLATIEPVFSALGEFTFALVVEDAHGASDIAVCTVSVVFPQECANPVAVTSETLVVHVDSMDDSASADLDGSESFFS